MIARFRNILASRHNVRAHFWQSLANYVQQGGSVILGVFLARLLSPDDFGAIAYAAALIGLICLPLDWTAAQVLVSDRGQTPELFSEVMSLGVIVMVGKALLTLGVVVWQLLAGHPLNSILVALAGLGLVAGTAVGIYRAAAEGSGHFKANFQAQFITLALSFAIGVGLAWAGAGVYALAAMSLVTVIPPLIVFPRFVKHQFKWRFNRQVIKNKGTDGFWLWLNSISMGSITRVDRLYLGKSSTVAELGNYTRAYNYTGLSHLLLNSLMTNAAVVSLASTSASKVKFRILFVNLFILLCGGFINFLIFFYFSDIIIPFVFGSQWAVAIPIFEAFASINIFTSLLYVPITYLLSINRFKEVALSNTIGLLSFVCMLQFYDELITGVSVAWQMQCSLLMASVACWFYVYKFRYTYN